MEEIRFTRAEWPEACKRLHRRGLAIKAMRSVDKSDPDADLIVSVEPELEVRS